MIFIDANKYLEFYSDKEYKKLLPSIVELKDEIFITKQIVDEVARCKLRIVNRLLTAFAESLKDKKYSNYGVAITLPDIFDTNDNPTVKKWNSDKGTFNSKVQEAVKEGIEELRQDLQELTTATLTSIMQGEDNVSKALKGIFDTAVVASDAELKKARTRKELGNPPGKPEDPLGDQLSWEQLLSKISKNHTQELWIITNDSDYISRCGTTVLLNSLLYQELKERGIKEVHCFDNLSIGLTEYNTSHNKKIQSLPNPDELEKIAAAEESNIAAHAQVGFSTAASLASTNYRSIVPTIYGYIPEACPYCHAINSFTGEVLRPSQLLGGYTYQQMCKNCNGWIDTGMDYY